MQMHSSDASTFPSCLSASRSSSIEDAANLDSRKGKEGYMYAYVEVPVVVRMFSIVARLNRLKIVAELDFINVVVLDEAGPLVQVIAQQ